MKKSTQGAWIIHHTKKLQAVTSQDFDQLAFAGKCGLLLSGIAASNCQNRMTITKVEAFSKANGISARSELPTILDELEKQRLIQRATNEVEILGLSTNSVLDYTSTIFQENNTPEEVAIIEASEIVSEKPMIEKELTEFISDTHKIPSKETSELLIDGKHIGFFDSETDHKNKTLFFNGNLFRTEDVHKINSVMNTLSDNETTKLNELNDILTRQGCIDLTLAKTIISDHLFNRLQSIGLYDVNSIGNERGKHFFVTRPAAFSKFTSSIADDAFDLAKKFVSALTYGMTKSAHARGKIQAFSALMRKLINGDWVGPASAIGQDYQILEMAGVLELRHEKHSMYSMRLLKSEVGELALAVIQEGEAKSTTIPQFQHFDVSANSYDGPEINRTIIRKNITGPSKKSIALLLSEIRTGGLTK